MDAIKNLGYRCQALGGKLIDNPYHHTLPEHWLWREGFLEAFKDSN